MASEKVQTTLRISKKIHGRFKEIVGGQKGDMGKVMEELIARWSEDHAQPRGERFQLAHTVNLLSNAVCEQLRQNPQWAEEAIIGAGLGLPGATVFDRRISHFSDEKQELGKRLGRWVLARALHHVHDGKRVHLIFDSGTTVFWLLKAFGEAINEYLKKPGKKDRVSDVTIVTNNIPGAESFVTYASHHKVPSGSDEVYISDLVECRLLAGTFLPEYVAITGDDTERDLVAYAKRVRAEDNNRGGAVLMGITTGNWVTVQKSDGLMVPRLLARGRGHGAFKSKLIEASDEIIVMAPLGKVMIETSERRLNDMLSFTAGAKNPQDKSYEMVPMSPRKSKLIKLVSTVREKDSVLRDHSALLSKALGEYALLEAEPSSAASSIDEAKHLLFPFDKFSSESTEAQLEVELPHPRTRTARFKKEIFSMRT